jgi:tRNA nucleotidyltransferase (CCA-adding enzyme)
MMQKKGNYTDIRKKILPKIKPTKKEISIFKKAGDEMISILERRIADNNIEARISVGGSVAKDTQLKDAKDIDIFIKYPPVPYAHKDISEITYKILKKEFEHTKRIHATRDYFHLQYKSILFEIIPVIEVANATLQHRIMDASPHHVEYVNKKIRNTDEVRMLKQFLKAQKMYGAESHIRGFSGYVCELLIIKYQTLLRLLKEASSWDIEGTFIDIEGHYNNPDDASETVSSGKHTPIIIIDPVQPNRNASASIDDRTYRKFIEIARIFIKNPTLRAFSHPLIKYEGSGIIISITDTKKNDDTLPARLRSLHDRIVRELSEFIVTGEDWEYDEQGRKWTSRVWLGTFILPKLQEIQGPPITLTGSVAAFKKKHARTMERDARIYAIEPRRIRTPEKKISEIIKESRHVPKSLKVMIERRDKL